MPLENIVVRGAREHNLKNVNVTIPRNKVVVITGVSGFGKSSWPSTRATPTGSVATWSHCRNTRGSSSGTWTSQTMSSSQSFGRRYLEASLFLGARPT